MKKRGFTVIEIVIALILFGIGIVTLLRAIVYYVAAGEEVRQKSEAILLAKEAIDIVYNQRDTNIRRSVKRNCARIDATKPEACDYIFEAGSTFRAEFNGFSGYVIVPTTSGDIANTLYTHINNTIPLYTHEVNEAPSPYSRYVTFDNASLGATGLGSGEALKITVYVMYNRGGAARKVVLESILSAGEKSN